MDNNYDKVANYYDRLSRLVFFKAQVNAQIHQLKYLPEYASVLIVGGGTGWILEELANVYSNGLQIVYVEISQKMIDLSKRRNVKHNKVEFINCGIEKYKTDRNFDVILTPFLFDNFVQPRIKLVFYQLHSLLKKNGLWLITDFYVGEKAGRSWKRLLLKSMYIFFKLLNIVEASTLINMDSYFEETAYKLVEEKFYYGKFIKASVLRKI